MLTPEQQLELAKEIAAANRGECEMPSQERLREAVDTIRARRADFVAVVKERKPKAPKAEKEPKAPARIEQLDLKEFGL